MHTICTRGVCKSTGEPIATFILPTESLRKLVLEAYIKRGWKYFVRYKDTQGFGLMCRRYANWQDADSWVSVQ